MAEFDHEILADVAFAFVNPGDPPSFFVNRGFASIVRNGVGDYTLALDPDRALDDNVMGVFVNGAEQGPPNTVWSSVHQSNGQIRVVSGIDTEFYVRVVRLTNSFS